MSQLPSREDLLAWLQENPGSSSKRDISRAFGIKGSARVGLKNMLRELQDEGLIERRRRSVRPSGELPPVGIIRITTVDDDGDLLAVPKSWEGDGEAPAILVIPRKSDKALGPGDHVLAKLRRTQGEPQDYEARPIKKISAAGPRLLGIFRAGRMGGRIVPIDKRASKEWTVPAGSTLDARDGELVEAEAIEGPRQGLPRGRIVECHGDPSAPGQVSLMAMVQHQIPIDFTPDVLKAAEKASEITSFNGRRDLTDLPLVTIDPPDARDHDDAICAIPDPSKTNGGGHIVWVAIADVAAYVKPGTELDRAARERGNSSYFPDRVSPMLPDRLSADLCSLHEGVLRPCVALRMVLNAKGDKISHEFVRGMMRSPASLDYATVQTAIDGTAADVDPEMLENVLKPLYAAYASASAARGRRQPLDLNLPERQIKLSQDGQVDRIDFRDRLDAHRLIEEFMVLANVCAAETLEQHRTPLIYRVHEEPNPEKLDALRETLAPLGLTLAKGQVLKTSHLNHLLRQAHGTESADAVSMSVLRAQTQAYYSPQNYGHFGLSLAKYAHFTSPIRRYADLIVHRALIRACGLGDDGLGDEESSALTETAEHISRTERRSMEAERDTIDRYVAAFLSDRVGGEFEGTISGISRAGLFVRLDETGADGLIPISTLGADYFRYDPDLSRLEGERTGQKFEMGMQATVRLFEATPVTGGLIFELRSVEGKTISAGRRGSNRAKSRRSIGRGKLAKAKAKRRNRR